MNVGIWICDDTAAHACGPVLIVDVRTVLVDLMVKTSSIARNGLVGRGHSIPWSHLFLE